MKSEWTIRWWDVVALALAMGAAVMVIQYSLSRGSATEGVQGIALVELRVLRPLPEVIAQLAPGDALLDRQGKKVGEIVSIQPVQPIPIVNVPQIPVPVIGLQDMRIQLRVEGALQLMRDTPGFSREPSNLRAGVWCLVVTSKVELSGLVTRVETYKEGQGIARTSQP